MSEEMEQGFLSQKFEDWSSEPIPNGWAKINAIIEKDRNKTNRKPLWYAFGFALVMGSLVGAYIGQDSKIPLAGENKPEVQTVPKIENLDQPLQTKPAPQTTEKELISISASETQLEIKAENQIETSSRLANHQSAGLISKMGSTKPAVGRGENQLKPAALVVAASNAIPSTTGKNEGKEDVVGKSPSEEVVSLIKSDGNDNLVFAETAASPVEGGIEQANAPKNFPLISTVNEVITFLETKDAILQIPFLQGHGNLTMVDLDRKFPITKPASKLAFSVGMSFGYAPRVIEINQNEAVRRMAVSSSGQGIQSGFSDIGFSMQHEIKPWIRSFASLRLGFLRHSISLTETSKTPSGYEMSTTDGENFTMVPTWSTQSGNFQQDIYYSNIEFGLNPILFSRQKSGPFASAVVWVALKQRVTSEISGATDGMVNQTENVALSYRIGYQHTFSGFLRAEIFTSGMPDKILANSKGLSIKPQLFGLGIHYLFH